VCVQDLSSQKAEGSAQGDSYRAQLAEAHAANDALHRQLEALEQEHRELQRFVDVLSTSMQTCARLRHVASKEECWQLS
jgi:Tfp pilus assembly protein PilN